MITIEKDNQYWIELEEKHTAYNYKPLPVVLERGEDIYLWDTEGKKYIDCLSAYSAVNQGHCHPKIINTLVEQARKLTLTSRAFHSKQFAIFTEFITAYFGYSRFLPTNSGVEAVESAIKLCRKWAYQIKGLPENGAKIIVCEHNFHGRTISVVSASTDETARNEFGPFTPGFITIPFNDINALKKALEDPLVAGFLVEPIQGEAGVIVPDDGYLKTCAELCRSKKVLMMADEIQTGIGRTGKLLACDYEEVHPDILILGKALSGGAYPVSGVLGNDEVMLCLKPGEHGSTYGGNPLACAVAQAALEVIHDEGMIENSLKLGELFRTELLKISHSALKTVRGKGLMNAIVIDHSTGITAWEVCVRMMKMGVLAKPTHGDTIRLAPPLTITEDKIIEIVAIIRESLKS